MIIGFIGGRLSGKTEAAKILRMEYNCVPLSFGDEVRLERNARRLPEDHDLHNLGVSLRDQFGPQYWGIRVAGRIVGDARDRRYVVEGIRTPGDVEVFRVFPDFTLIGIDASVHTRYNRQSLNLRNRPEDGETFEKFFERDKRDRSSGPGGLCVDEAMKLAEMTINNNSSIDAFKDAISGAFLMLLKKEKICN